MAGRTVASWGAGRSNESCLWEWVGGEEMDCRAAPILVQTCLSQERSHDKRATFDRHPTYAIAASDSQTASSMPLASGAGCFERSWIVFGKLGVEYLFGWPHVLIRSSFLLCCGSCCCHHCRIPDRHVVQHSRNQLPPVPHTTIATSIALTFIECQCTGPEMGLGPTSAQKKLGCYPSSVNNKL